MYKIAIEPFGEINKIILKNTVSGEFAEIIADNGAALNNLAFKKNDQLIEVVEGNVNYNSMLGEGKPRYYGHLLFPFPNRIKNGIYIYKGKLYQLDINETSRNHSLHGLVFDKPFKLIKQEATSEFASIEIYYEIDGTNAGYPFKISATVIYKLEKGALTIETIVKNLDKQTVPFGMGWHPYFKIGDKVDDLEVQFPSHKVFELDEKLIPTEKLVISYDFISKERIDNIWIDRGCLLTKDEDISTLSIQKDDVTLDIWLKRGKHGLNYLQVYIPPTRSSIAIEPQSSAADVFNNKIGLIELEPGEVKNFVWGIKMGELK